MTTLAPSPNDLLTPPEVAARLRISVRRTYELLADGTVRTVRVGERLLRVRRGELDDWIAAHNVRPDPPTGPTA